MRENLKELWKFRELLFSMVQRELRVRYKNSVLGFFWSMINPLLTVVVMTVVFKYFVGNETPNFSAYVLSAYLPYMFFQFCLLDSAQSILGALPLVKKIYFPREILPLSLIISNFIHFLLALVVFFAYLLVIFIRDPQTSPFQASVAWLPLLLVVNLCLATGLGLLFAALNTFYEDVKYLLSIVLYLLFFLCPIMYFSEQVFYTKMLGEGGGGTVYFLYHLNPVATMVDAYRKVLLAPQPVKLHGVTYESIPLNWKFLAITAVFSIFILFYGYHVFNKMKWKFVERP